MATPLPDKMVISPQKARKVDVKIHKADIGSLISTMHLMQEMDLVLAEQSQKGRDVIDFSLYGHPDLPAVEDWQAQRIKNIYESAGWERVDFHLDQKCKKELGIMTNKFRFYGCSQFDMMMLDEISALVKKTDGLDFSTAQEGCAQSFYHKIRESKQDNIFKKYGRVPEPLLLGMANELENTTKDYPVPVFNLELTPSHLMFYHQVDRTQFYKSIVRRMLVSAMSTRWHEGKGATKLWDLLEHDFAKLYSGNEGLLKHHVSLGRNIDVFLQELTNSCQDRPVVHMNFVGDRIYPKTSLVDHEEMRESCSRVMNPQYERSAMLAGQLMMDFLRGPYEMKKAVSIPGWIMDVAPYWPIKILKKSIQIEYEDQVAGAVVVDL